MALTMDERPNILFIMADDHAAKAISCYGAGINRTPHLDLIAYQGMLFNHCYVTNSLCTPSRASIITGTYNHVNSVYTLRSTIDNRTPNVAKHLRTGGYQTAMIGKWHLGEGIEHEPTGFDFWSVLPDQGDYHDPVLIEMGKTTKHSGYVTDILTDKALNWLKSTDKENPFFLMLHHKAPHRSWEYDPKHKHLYQDPIKVPDTFNDDYKNRAKAAAAAKMRVEEDLTYFDLGLVQPDEEIMVPNPKDVAGLQLIDSDNGTVFTFRSNDELRHFKYQRYMQKYLRTIQSIDENVGRILDYLEEHNLTENTIVIYTSDQGFFLGDHGWFDKRFMYEESFQMPFIVRYPRLIKPGTICNDIISNVDFAPTFLDLADLKIPSYMQGYSFQALLKNETPENWQKIAYHRYWMHQDEVHNAYAHYGIRNQRYKLIYWYNEGYGLPGTQKGGQKPEWELFDCQEDPLELLNVYKEKKYQLIVKNMTRLLEDKMAEIGDEPAHELSLNYVS